MSTRLVILGLLQERPLYGYEIKQLIEEHPESPYAKHAARFRQYIKQQSGGAK